MSTCDHARFCGKRMAHGDRADGCSQADQRTCSPELSLRERTPTAPPKAVSILVQQCSYCASAGHLLGQWQHKNPLCECKQIRAAA